MAAEIINLRRARKARARASRAAEAAGNRVRFGRSSSERERDMREEERARRHHAGHRLDKTDGEDNDGDGRP